MATVRQSSRTRKPSWKVEDDPEPVEMETKKAARGLSTRSAQPSKPKRKRVPNTMNMEHMQAELNNVLNTISNSSSRGRSATTRRADQKKHVKSGKGKTIATMTTTRTTRSSRRLHDITNTSEGNLAAAMNSPPADEALVTSTEPSCSPSDLSSTTDATGSSYRDTSPLKLTKNRNSDRKSKGSPSDDESMEEEEAGIEGKDGSVESMTDDSIAAVESNDNDVNNDAQDVTSSSSSGAPRRTMRIRKTTSRYSLESQEGSDEDAYSMEQNEESDSEPEGSFAEEEEEFETDEEEEEEWNPKQDAWAKEAALYDSSLEQSDSEADEYSDDDDLLEGHQRKATGKKRKRRKMKPRKKFPKPRAIRRSIDVLPALSVEEKLVYLANIENDKDEEEEDSTLLYQFLQCTMWDFDYRYNLLSHQFKGVLAVAGVDYRALSAHFDGFEEQEQGLLVNLGEEGVAFRREICSSIAFVKTKGILLGDDMGLGKTVQGLGAAILRNCIYAIQSESDKKIRKKMPTVIIGPNRDVLDQWEESLLVSGVHVSRIKFFWALDDKLRQGDTFILLTRYELMSEIRNMMLTKKSNLYPQIDTMLLNMLDNQYMAGQSKARNEYRNDNETESQCVTRLLRNNAHRLRVCFRTILIDEAHFLKNLVSYWGIATALLGMVSHRSVPLSGTPYNNGPQDMATLMAFIDPNQASSDVKWWQLATEGSHYGNIAKYVAAWKENYMIRRDKSVLSIKLPQKHIESYGVAPFPTELSVYCRYENSFLKALKEFSKLADRANARPEDRARQKELFTVLMATMSQMRMALIHPLLPGGRELTIRFSPSRREMVSKCSKDLKLQCVCCKRFPTQAVPDKASESMSEQEIASALADGGGTGEDEQLQDENFGNGGQQKKNPKQKKQNEKLVPLDSDICYALNECKHYAHESCIQELMKNCDDELKCPRCKDLEIRMRIAENSDDVPHETYCEHIDFGPYSRGIKATAKIQEIVKWAKEIPKGDKAIVYSFFKGGLDLIEGIFVEHLGIECARFDGDVTPEERSRELVKFKTSKTCQILLASVQSSGVGLNIVEANHVAFLDRWFNPCVHAQAEDRCHRLKQTKEVHVSYYDVNCTVDQVMATINNMKKNNASILLADGSQIGAQQNSVKYRDLSGSIGDMMKALVYCRSAFETTSPKERYDPISEDVLVLASDEKGERNTRRKSEGKKEAKPETSLSADDTRDKSVKSEYIQSDGVNDTKEVLPDSVFSAQTSSFPIPSVIESSAKGLPDTVLVTDNRIHSKPQDNSEGLPGPAFKIDSVDNTGSEEEGAEGLPGPAFKIDSANHTESEEGVEGLPGPAFKIDIVDLTESEEDAEGLPGPASKIDIVDLTEFEEDAEGLPGPASKNDNRNHTESEDDDEGLPGPAFKSGNMNRTKLNHRNQSGALRLL